MKGKLALRVFLSCDKLCSVNKRLWGSASRGMRHSWDYEHQQQQLRQSLVDNGVLENLLDGKHLYSVTYVFYLKDNISRRDTDNLMKGVTDVLSKYLGFNDNKIISYKVSKRQVEDSDKEYVLVEVEEIEGWWDSLKIKLEEFVEFVRRYTGDTRA